MDFSYEALPNRIVFARGAAHARVADEADALGLGSLILISGYSSPAVEGVRTVLGPRVVAEFSDPRQHVPAELAASLRAYAAEFELDGIVSVGGGSTTGAAKILALTTGLPIIAIPTTYAGSEVTPIWGMTTDGDKRTGRDLRVLPRTVIYDPDLVSSLPRDASIASALNAMAHCIDGMWSPGANPVSALIATEGIRALADGLRGCTGVIAAETVDRLVYGSYLAGSAFAVTGSGLHHKICHALGGGFDLPHAELHAVMLPVITAFNADHAPAELARIADGLGVEDVVGELRTIYRAVGAPTSLLEIGLEPTDRERAIDLIAGRLPIANPRPVDHDAVVAIVDAALHTPEGTR